MPWFLVTGQECECGLSVRARGGALTCGGAVSELLQLHESGVGQIVQLEVIRRREERRHAVYRHLPGEGDRYPCCYTLTQKQVVQTFVLTCLIEPRNDRNTIMYTGHTHTKTHKQTHSQHHR